MRIEKIRGAGNFEKYLFKEFPIGVVAGFCVVQRPTQSHQYIREGKGKRVSTRNKLKQSYAGIYNMMECIMILERGPFVHGQLYRDNEPECSELCQCGEGEVLVCNTICVKPSPCKTDFAFYNHAAPAYQAYRGRCLCYSGRFICMRPSPGE